jgi:hypothetical protein
LTIFIFEYFAINSLSKWDHFTCREKVVASPINFVYTCTSVHIDHSFLFYHHKYIEFWLSKGVQTTKKIKHAQVERCGHFTDRITAVISGTEIRPYHNEVTALIRPYTVKMRPRIRCRITVPKITRKYSPFTAPYEANSRWKYE